MQTALPFGTEFANLRPSAGKNVRPLNTQPTHPMLEEFKKFILKGNMIDLAVGVIIGGAFGKVVEKFTECIMSMIGFVLEKAGVGGNVTNFDSWNPGGIKIGAVITQIINLLLVGFALFIFIKAYNKWLIKPAPAPAPAAPPEPTPTEKLLAEIRDTLKSQGQ